MKKGAVSGRGLAYSETFCFSMTVAGGGLGLLCAVVELIWFWVVE